MVTVVYRVQAQKGREREFQKIALTCVECARANKDCLYYSFFKSLTDPKEFIVYNRFKSRKAQDIHIANLQEKIGPAKSKRDLPNNFLKLLDEEEVVLFNLK